MYILHESYVIHIYIYDFSPNCGNFLLPFHFLNGAYVCLCSVSSQFLCIRWELRSPPSPAKYISLFELNILFYSLKKTIFFSLNYSGTFDENQLISFFGSIFVFLFCSVDFYDWFKTIWVHNSLNSCSVTALIKNQPRQFPRLSACFPPVMTLSCGRTVVPELSSIIRVVFVLYINAVMQHMVCLSLNTMFVRFIHNFVCGWSLFFSLLYNIPFCEHHSSIIVLLMGISVVLGLWLFLTVPL